MDIARDLHIPLDAEAAFQRQRELARELDLSSPTRPPRLIGAADVAYAKDGSDEAYAAVVVLERDTLRVIDRADWVGPPAFDYLPGLFALREAATLVEAFKKLSTRPDVVLIDGHGIAHPRRFGLACQLGLTFGVPTVGCAKKRLCGKAEPLGPLHGSRARVLDKGETIGYALRTQDGIKPVWVSPGNGYDHASAVDLVMSVRGEYRIPEPLRQAHNASVELRAAAVEANG